MARPLNDRQKRLLEAYVASDRDVKQAAALAGYSLKTARKVVKRPDAIEHVEELERNKPVELTVEMIRQRMWHQSDENNPNSTPALRKEMLAALLRYELEMLKLEREEAAAKSEDAPQPVTVVRFVSPDAIEDGDLG